MRAFAMKHRLLLVALTCVALVPLVAWAVGESTARNANNIQEAFYRMNGEHIHRATLTPDATTAEDNVTAAGGTAVAYTFLGGERVCYEAVTTDAYVQVIAAASYTAANAKARYVKADQPGDVVCDTLLVDGPKKVSALCSAAGPCLVKVFEVR